MRVSRLAIPLLVIAALFAGYFLRLAFTQPTTAVTYAAIGSADDDASQATFVVEGVKCKGTAAFFSSLYEGVPGVISIETFATEQRAIFTYNPNLITTDSIRAIMEAPIDFDDGTSMKVFRCLSIE